MYRKRLILILIAPLQTIFRAIGFIIMVIDRGR
jgi:hypothetical protein